MIDFDDKIKQLVQTAMKDTLGSNSNYNYPFLDIDDYRTKTGKRFRMTKSQRDQGLTREQSFRQFMESLMEKV